MTHIKNIFSYSFTMSVLGIHGSVVKTISFRAKCCNKSKVDCVKFCDGN